MNELHDSLDRALRTVIPGEPPVQEAMRRGRSIRIRRRAAVLASAVAVALFAAVGYPALTHRQALRAPEPVSRQPVVVTDIPPGPGAPAGLIASGVIGRQSWRVVAGKPGTGAPRGQQCFSVSGTAVGQGPARITECGPPSASPSPGTPVSFEDFAAGALGQVSIGRVGGGVVYVTVRLAGGSELKLIPVTVYGTRYVAFASPAAVQVAGAVAYLGNGQYRASVPFDAPGGVPLFGMWLPPGQHAQPRRLTRLIGSGVADGNAWSVSAFTGPWGTCLVDTLYQRTACVPTTAPLGTHVLSTVTGPPRMYLGTAANSVSSLTVTLTSGATLRVATVAVAEQKFFVLVLGKGQTVRHWTIRDAAGRPVTPGGI